MVTAIRLPQYDSYKDSGVSWIGDIPERWEIKSLKAVLTERKEKNNPVKTKDILSLCMYRGVIPYAEKGNSGNKAKDDLTAYRLAYPGDIVLNSMNVIVGSVGLSKYFGAVSPVYYMLRPRKSDDCVEYFDAVFQTECFQKNLSRLGHGILIKKSESSGKLNTIRMKISMSKLNKELIPYPSPLEQQRIANFLDQKTGEIDEAIAKKQRLIELLKEQKAILINQAVTKGLNPNISIRDSGVEWVGEIPEHWSIKRAKFLFKEVDERSHAGTEELLSVSHLTGVTPRSEKNVYMFKAADYAGSKLCKKGDLVFNIMWAWMGALGVSSCTGIISPSYGVYRPLSPELFNDWYLEHLVRSDQYVAEYNRRSTGLTSSRLRLYSHMFFDMEIGFPPIEEQNEIEEKITAQTMHIDKTVKSIATEVEKLKELREVFISQAVTGKIKV